MSYSILGSAVGIFFIYIGIYYTGTPKIAGGRNFLYWLTITFLWFAVAMFWLLTTAMIGGALFLLKQAFDATPQIIFDSEGIVSKTFNTEKVYWNEIEEAFLIDSNTIGLKLRDQDKYLSEIQSSRFFKAFPGSVLI